MELTGKRVTSQGAAAAARASSDGMPGSRRRLRVLFVTEDDPIYVIRFFDTFLARVPAGGFESSG